MGKQMIEMFKGILEGIVLVFFVEQLVYGYEIIIWLWEYGFIDIVEGIVYVLLVRIEQKKFVDVEKVLSEKGLFCKVYILNVQGCQELEEFWIIWSFFCMYIE